MTFDEFTRRYWRANQRDKSENTVLDYTRTFNKLAAWLGENHPDIDAEEITPEHINDYLNDQEDLGLSRKSVANQWVALSSLWTWAETKYSMPHILRGHVACPKVKRQQPQPYTELEIKAMVRATAYNAPWRGKPEVASKRHWCLRDKAILITLVDTGIRASELCALKIADYDPKIGQLVIRHGKGDKFRIVPLGDRACDVIDDYLDARRKAMDSTRRERAGRPAKRAEIPPDDPLFATNKGNAMARDQLLNMVQACADRAEPPVPDANVHRFRHTFAINYLRKYPNIYTLQRVLGHNSLETVRIYLAISEVDIHQAHRTASIADNWRL